ncbi:MAG TPA: hypothetical protein VFM76_01645 [Methylophaga sp.]|nr:hypothetical protein [Methylophaga sp.]
MQRFSYIVDNGYCLRLSAATLSTPFTYELSDDRVIEIFSPGCVGSATTTWQLSAGQDDIKESAAGIGIDFNEPWTLLTEVEIKPHKSTYRARIKLCGFWWPGQYLSLIISKRSSSFDGLIASIWSKSESGTKIAALENSWHMAEVDRIWPAFSPNWLLRSSIKADQ